MDQSNSSVPSSVRFLVSRLINRTGVVTMATQATPQSLEHEQLFSDVTSLIREYLIKYSDRSTKVCVGVRGVCVGKGWVWVRGGGIVLYKR